MYRGDNSGNGERVEETTDEENTLNERHDAEAEKEAGGAAAPGVATGTG